MLQLIFHMDKFTSRKTHFYFKSYNVRLKLNLSFSEIVLWKSRLRLTWQSMFLPLLFYLYFRIHLLFLQSSACRTIGEDPLPIPCSCMFSNPTTFPYCFCLFNFLYCIFQWHCTERLWNILVRSCSWCSTAPVVVDLIFFYKLYIINLYINKMIIWFVVCLSI